jgi:polyisoprenoid-binding protein YceI
MNGAPQTEKKMTPIRALTVVAALVATATSVMAQGASMTLRPESKVVVNGRSNVHDWSLTAEGFQAAITLDSAYDVRPLAELTKPIRKVVVTIPTKSLKSGKGKMDDNTYKALKAAEFPEIRYVLDTYEVTKVLENGFTATTSGALTVAGVTTKVEIPITAERKAGGAMTAEGAVPLRMTDFGIKPPVALLGTLRTKNEITITFEVLLNKSVLVALTEK